MHLLSRLLKFFLFGSRARHTIIVEFRISIRKKSVSKYIILAEI